MTKTNKMKTSKFTCLIIILLGLFLINGKSKKEIKEEYCQKRVDESLVKIKDSLYACKYELSNIEYRIFLKDIEKQGKQNLLEESKIDTINWLYATNYCEPYVEYYFRHPAYNNYPVVNVSYEGAVNYCNWLTDKYNSTSEKKFKKVKFRLPIEDEWIYAAKGGDSTGYPFPSTYDMDSKGIYLYNFTPVSQFSIYKDKKSNEYKIINHKNNVGAILWNLDATPARVESYTPNNYGIYNICGNAAEMIQEKGKTKGGSYLSTGYNLRLDVFDTYEKSDVDIGFRYFMEIIEK